MIVRPRHAANEGLVVGGLVLQPVAGLDLEATAERVGEWGGDRAVYATVLASSLAALGDVEAVTVRALATIAGWRAGVIDLRDEALRQAAVVPGPAAAAALAIHPAELDWFLDHQRDDRYALPGSGPVIATVGGFRGYGGPWPAPPLDPRPLGGGRVAVTVAGGDWTLHIDVFGARLVEGAATAAPGELLHATVSTDSHLVTISRHAP